MGACARHFANKDFANKDFANKESLLTAVAAESWERLGDHLHALSVPLPADVQRDVFLAIVAAVAGEPNAQRCAPILLTGSHGAVGMVLSDLPPTDALVTIVAESGQRH